MNNAIRLLLFSSYRTFPFKKNKCLPILSKIKSSTASSTIDYDKEIDEKFGVGSIYSKLDTKSNQHEVEDTDESESFGKLSDKLSDPKFNVGLINSRLDEKIKNEAQLAYKQQKLQLAARKEININLNNIELVDEKDGKYPANYYHVRIKEFANNNQIEDALKVFYNDMIKRDKIRPSLWTMQLLIKICSRSGHLSETFNLFEMIHQCGLTNFRKAAMHKIITLMFLAISKANVTKEEGLARLKQLESFLNEHTYEPSVITCTAMIFCYSKVYNFNECVRLVDEFEKKNLIFNDSIFANLMCAANNEEKGGFRYALDTWQRMLNAKIKPNIYSYNLLLRAARSCSLYEKNHPNDVAKKLQKKSSLSSKSEKQQQQSETEDESLDVVTLKASNNDLIVNLKESDVTVIDDLQVVGESISRKIQNLEWWQKLDENFDKEELLEPLVKSKNQPMRLTNLVRDSILVSPKFDLHSIKLDDDSPSGRLNMLGGVQGLFEMMSYHNVKPNIKTFILIIECAENSYDIDRKILKTLDLFKIDYHIDFLNELLKRSVLRNDELAKNEVLRLIQKNQLVPTLRTFSSLAHGVHSKKQLIEYLEDLKKFNFKLTEYTAFFLLTRSIRSCNTAMLEMLANTLVKDKIELEIRHVEVLKDLFDKIHKEIIEKEKKGLKYVLKDDVKYKKMKFFYKKSKQAYESCLRIKK